MTPTQPICMDLIVQITVQPIFIVVMRFMDSLIHDARIYPDP